MKKISLAISLILTFPSLYANAATSHIVYNPDNMPVFQINFFDVDDGPFIPDWPQPLESSWNLNQQQKDKILNAMSYWAEVIKPTPGQLPAIINVGTFDMMNAVGASEFVGNRDMTMTQLQAALSGMDSGELTLGSHAQFVIGKLDFDDLPYIPSQVPVSGKVDLSAVAIHELAHGLGISTLVTDIDGFDTYSPAFDADIPLNTWTQHLRDDNGNAAKPGQVILCDGCQNDYDPQGFDVRRDQGYFSGQHVDEVLAGAMPGVPIKILSSDGDVDDDYMSHIELKNSMMSHQDYRNYTTFMEAELAILQDMGYQIDRRNFFGFSVYGDGQTLVNHKGYFQRNAQGDAYLPNQYNRAKLGVGLHIYGSQNQISQQGDLLTIGDGGAGVRIDGQGNTLSVESGTRIYADGLHGRGIMFTYGKNHNLIQQGDIQALGEDGIALDFNFGNNLLGNEEDYRGSYIHYVDGYVDDLLPELDGALADHVDISGRVAGKAAAIFISQNALVNQINILNGAKIEGNIYSFYDELDEMGEQRLTQLTFGRLADAKGRATSDVDSNFRFNYIGDIQGIQNVVIEALGGVTSLNGEHEIYDVSIAQNAVLMGDSHYTLNEEGLFTNEGILSPGNSLGQVTITGDYLQGSNGQLLLEVNGRGEHDSFIVEGHAELDGELTFAPTRDWYDTNWQLNTDDFLAMSSSEGEFTAVNGQLNSPTLTLNVTPQGENTWQLTMDRAANAYSQYANDSNAQQVGNALDQIVSTAQSDIQPLYRALDFSAADGQTIGRALNQLSPAGYSAMFASSLNREQQIASIINTRQLISSAANDGEWQSFAIPFGGRFKQKHQDELIGYNTSSYGIIFGAEKQSATYRHWQFGLHGAVSGQSISVKSPENGSGKMTAFDLGLHAYYAKNPQVGTYLFGQGRLGIEDSQMTRHVQIDDYSESHKASWTGLTGSLMAGGGYRWALTKNLNAGPVIALNYNRLSRKGVSENGAESSRLKLDSKAFDSLHSSIGVNSNWQLPLASGAMVKTHLQLSWEHELLNPELTQNASFANYRDTRFSSKNKVIGRDALGLKAGARYQITRNFEVGADFTGQKYHSGNSSMSGNLSATWRF